MTLTTNTDTAADNDTAADSATDSDTVADSSQQLLHNVTVRFTTDHTPAHQHSISSHSMQQFHSLQKLSVR